MAEINWLHQYRAHRDEADALADPVSLFILGFTQHVGATSIDQLVRELNLTRPVVRQKLLPLLRGQFIREVQGVLNVTERGAQLLTNAGILAAAAPPPQPPPPPPVQRTVAAPPPPPGRSGPSPYMLLFLAVVLMALVFCISAAFLLGPFSPVSRPTVVAGATGSPTATSTTTLTPTTTSTPSPTPTATNTPTTTPTTMATGTPSPTATPTVTSTPTRTPTPTTQPTTGPTAPPRVFLKAFRYGYREAAVAAPDYLWQSNGQQFDVLATRQIVSGTAIINLVRLRAPQSQVMFWVLREDTSSTQPPPFATERPSNTAARTKNTFTACRDVRGSPFPLGECTRMNQRDLTLLETARQENATFYLSNIQGTQYWVSSNDLQP